MNRSSLFLAGVVGCFSLVLGAGCGDSTGTGSGGGGTGGGGTGGGTTTTGTTTTGTTTTGTTTTGGATTCASYCDTMGTSCAGANEQYVTNAACQAECAAFVQGTAGDMGMDTLECRAYHAGVAAGDPGAHCVHAGPLGGAGATGGCGTDRCSAYCDIVMEVCGTQATPPFASKDACETNCATIANTEPFDIGDTTGNTLACRMYHLSVAAQGGTEPATHCPHLVAVTPTGICQ